MDRSGHNLPEDIVEEIRVMTYLSYQIDIGKSGICHIYKNMIWEDANSIYYVMPYCKCDLFDFINNQWNEFKTNPYWIQSLQNNQKNNKPYNPWIHIVKKIFRQIVKSINYLHTKGMYNDLYTLFLSVFFVFNKHHSIVICIIIYRYSSYGSFIGKYYVSRC